MPAKSHRISISTDECKGCLRCVPACPKKLISRGSGINVQGYVAVKVDNPGDCIGCGACFHQCPEPGAITIFVNED